MIGKSIINSVQFWRKQKSTACPLEENNPMQGYVPIEESGVEEELGEAFASKYLYAAKDLVAGICQQYSDLGDTQFEDEMAVLRGQFEVIETTLKEPRPGFDSDGLVKAFDALKTLASLKICAPYREILELLGEPIRFRLREIILQGMTQEKAKLAKTLYSNPDDYVRRGVEGGLGGNPSGVMVSATGARNTLNLRSDIDGVLGIKADDLSIGVGYGDPNLANVRFELMAKQERVSGYGTIKRFARAISENTVEGVLTKKWPKIFPRFSGSVVHGIYGAMDRLDTLLGDNGRIRSYVADSKSFGVPHSEMSPGFELYLKGLGTSIRGLAFNNSTRVKTSAYSMKGEGKVTRNELVDALLENNGYLYESPIQKILSGGLFREIVNPVAGERFAGAKEIDAFIRSYAKEVHLGNKEAQLPMDTLRQQLYEAAKGQEQDLLAYCKVVSEYDFARAKHSRSPETKALRREKHQMERVLGVKGRASYVQKSTILFAKLVKLHKDTYVDFAKKGYTDSSEYREIEALKATFRAPPLNLTTEQHIKGHRAQEAAEATSRCVDLQGEFDLTSWNIPVAVRAKIKHRFREKWHNPLSRGKFIEFEAQLTGKLPLGDWGSLGMVLAGQLKSRFASKFKSNDLTDIVTEVRKGMSLMSGVDIPNRMGARVKIMLRKDENGRYSPLFCRVFSVKGIDSYGVVSMPGAAMAEYRFDKEEAKVLREWVGGKTLNYLFRKCAGMIGTGCFDDWYNYVLPLKDQWTPAFMSIFDEDSSAAKEYKKVMEEVDFHIRHGGVSDDLKGDLVAKKEAFSKALALYKNSQSSLLYARLIERFTEFFALYHKEVFKHKRYRSYHIAV